MEKVLSIFGKTGVATGTATGSIAIAVLGAMGEIPGVDPNVQYMGTMLFGLIAIGTVVIASMRNPDGSHAKTPYEKKQQY